MCPSNLLWWLVQQYLATRVKLSWVVEWLMVNYFKLMLTLQVHWTLSLKIHFSVYSVNKLSSQWNCYTDWCETFKKKLWFFPTLPSQHIAVTLVNPIQPRVVLLYSRKRTPPKPPHKLSLQFNYSPYPPKYHSCLLCPAGSRIIDNVLFGPLSVRTVL
jgi:hypothetical protein